MFSQRFFQLSRTGSAAASILSKHRRNGLEGHKMLMRFLSSSAVLQTQANVRIFFASQGGTAQLFAHQLAEGVEEEAPDSKVTVRGMDEQPPEQLLSSSCHENDLCFFLVSCAGVGEPPDNGRDFYDWITKIDDIHLLKNLRYAVFGLGNQVAHPNHYNVIGKKLDNQLELLGAQRIQELGLGNDGDCIDDDFDQWMEKSLQLIGSANTPTTTKTKEEATEHEDESLAEAEDVVDVKDYTIAKVNEPRMACPGIATTADGTRLISSKYPTLTLRPSASDVVSPDLFHLQNSSQQFYFDGTVPLTVRNNILLTSDAGESGLHEIEVSIDGGNGTSVGGKELSYITGDHLLVYPRNSNAIVQAYVDFLDVDPHAIIDCTNDSYPHPKGITIVDTLLHCIDLGALPPPPMARLLFGRKHVDYKREVAGPRRTIIDLLYETDSKLSLEDLLYMAPPMKPRHYSIASSSMQHPQEIQLTYRPVKYMTAKGYLREGVCTSFMTHKGALQRQSDGSETQASHIPALIVRNPSFRLPSKLKTPVMMIGGGCGVAPIKAFLQERVFQSQYQNASFGPAILYMGYRNPQDEVHKDLVQQAMKTGALTEEKVVYSSGCAMPHQRCMLVSQLIREEGEKVWNHLESGGHTYMCGGAWHFGAAIKAELLELVQVHGKMDFEAAEEYLRNLMDQGKLSADLAD